MSMNKQENIKMAMNVVLTDSNFIFVMNALEFIAK